MSPERYPAIKAVLAAYRSERTHITEDQIQAAWSEYEALAEGAAQAHGWTRAWKLVSQPRHVFAHVGPEFPGLRCGSCLAMRQRAASPPAVGRRPAWAGPTEMTKDERAPTLEVGVEHGIARILPPWFGMRRCDPAEAGLLYPHWELIPWTTLTWPG